jgi:hypothetical protein
VKQYKKTNTDAAHLPGRRAWRRGRGGGAGEGKDAAAGLPANAFAGGLRGVRCVFVRVSQVALDDHQSDPPHRYSVSLLVLLLQTYKC